MTGDAELSGRRHRAGRFLPCLGIFAGGFVHSLLPRGMFEQHDLLARATITGAAAGTAALLIFLVARRWNRSSKARRRIA